MEPTHTLTLENGNTLSIYTEEDEDGWAAFPIDASDLRQHGVDADAAVAAFESEAGGLARYLSLKDEAGEEAGTPEDTPEGGN